MQYPAKNTYLPAILLLLLAISACRGKKDNTVKPPDPVSNIYLVTAIRVNNVPKDSLVYNDQYQVTQRWDYNTTYRKWQNYIAYSYNAEGYVVIAKYYNENDNSLKSLSQKDSLIWNTGNITTYTTYYRELGNGISGYDTTTLTTNEQQQLLMAGTTDTLLNPLGGPVVRYNAYTYQGNDLATFRVMSYLSVENVAGLIKQNFTLSYTSLANPLYPPLSKNPHLLRTIIQEQFPNTSDDYYPYLVSEHLVAGFQYETEAIPATSVVNTVKWEDSTLAPQTQIFAGGVNKSIGFTYRIIRP